MVYGFKIKELENNKNNLSQSLWKLELEKIQLESMNDLQSNLQKLNLVKVETIEYLKPWSGSLVISTPENKLK